MTGAYARGWRPGKYEREWDVDPPSSLSPVERLPLRSAGRDVGRGSHPVENDLRGIELQKSGVRVAVGRVEIGETETGVRDGETGADLGPQPDRLA
jgi:hypothetical protein